MEDAELQSGGGPSHLARIAMAIVVIVVLAGLVISSPAEEWTVATAQWIEGAGAIGVAAFALIYIVGVVIFFPASLLSMTAGFLFGLPGGLLLTAVSIPAGALVTFLVSRYVARNAVQKKVKDSPKFHAVERAISMEGFKMALLTRLVPIFPFTVLNYLFGVTRVASRRFLLGTSLGMIPTTVAYVYVGSVAGDLKRALAMEESPGPATYVMWAAGLTAMIVIVWLITRRARQELDALLAMESEQ